jgi:hypothetical protein
MKRLISLALLSSAVGYADIHSDLMRDVNFQTRSDETVETNLGDVEINYSGMSYEYNSKVFIGHTQKSSDVMRDYLISIGVTSHERCRDQSINVYDVEEEVLMSPQVYETIDWGDSSRSSSYGSRIAGLYDDTGPRTEPVTIYVDIDLFTTDRTRIISHEMAHFWHDQLCLSRQDIDTEQMAQDFETYYLERVNDRQYRRPRTPYSR